MNSRSVFHLVSFMVVVIGLAMGLCWGISLFYNDPSTTQWGLGISSVLAVVCGALLFLVTRNTDTLSRRDGFGIVTFGWISASLVGALPYILSGVIADPVSAVFETMSGFTTTGASVLTDIELIPKGILFWRAMTHFFGGMGVLVLCVAILPFLGVGGMQIYRAEMPGPSKDRLTPKIASTAKLLWGVYVLMCLVEAVLLRVGGMNWFDSFCHTFATMATGGFSTRTASMGAFDSVYLQTVVIVFMFLAGVNFSLHYRALRGHITGYFRDPEFRFYLGVWFSACLFLSLNVWKTVYPSLGHSLRAGFFQGTSILTTTGFCTEDFNVWPTASRVLLVALMFVGGCAGSTGGGMKNVRILIVLKQTVREILRFMRPQAVLKVKVGGKPVTQDSLSHITAFFAIFVLVFSVASFAMTFFTPDLETAFSSVIATLGNIGPGLSAVGATQNYALIPAAGSCLKACVL